MGNNPIDILIRLPYYEENTLIMDKLKFSLEMEFDGPELQIFCDLASETLTCRRVNKPTSTLLERFYTNIQWGFLAYLIRRHDSRSAILRFPEDIQDFCAKMDISSPALPGWMDQIP